MSHNITSIAHNHHTDIYPILNNHISARCSVACGAYRVRMFNAGYTVKDIWLDSTFVALSCLQKLVAVPYYALNIRAAVKLSDHIYFDKDAWISLVKQKNASVRR